MVGTTVWARWTAWLPASALEPRPGRAGGIALPMLLSLAFVVTITVVPAAPVRTAATCAGTTVAPGSLVVGLRDVSRGFTVSSTGCPAPSWTLDWATAHLAATSERPAGVVRAGLLHNADAGRSGVTLTLYREDGAAVLTTATAALRRRTAWTTPRASAGPAGTTVRARLNRADWDRRAYRGYRGRLVRLLFLPAGSQTFQLYGEVRTGAGGALEVTVPTTRPGRWKFEFTGTASSGPSSSPAVTAR
ncbi:hypothetical protein ACIB24_01500 [Spongisporangium articulatum]|uniref:Uncharacterized protein n=1 Tax=Spongisporangium articulatum TaxID=3362603 RepID=A0ABW8AH92_9ACTN